MAPLFRPVVPEVNMMSLRSPGRTAPARRRACAVVTVSARRSNAAQPPGIRTTSPSRSSARPPAPEPEPCPAAAARSVPNRSTPRKSPATNSARAPLRPITSSASGPVNRVLTGTRTPPAASVPSAASTQWWSLGPQTATRSPAARPASMSAAATVVTRSPSSE